MNPVASPSVPASLAGPPAGPRSADAQPHGGAATPFARLLERSAPPPASPPHGAPKTAGGATSAATERAAPREAVAPADEPAARNGAEDDGETPQGAVPAPADLLGPGAMPATIVDKAPPRSDAPAGDGWPIAMQGTVAMPVAAASASNVSDASTETPHDAAAAAPGEPGARFALRGGLDPSVPETGPATKPARPASRTAEADTLTGGPGEDPARIASSAPPREPAAALPTAERVEIQPGPAGGLPAPAPGALVQGPFDTPPGRLVAEAVRTPEVHLPMAPHAPAFASALGAQLRMWVRDGVQQAVLQLNPADLGPVAVQIALDGSRAHVDFVAAQATTRTVLEASLPTLAAALRESGLTLAGGGVFDQPRGGRDDTAPQGRGGSDTPRGDASPLVQAPAAAVVRARGVVDLVA